MAILRARFLPVAIVSLLAATACGSSDSSPTSAASPAAGGTGQAGKTGVAGSGSPGVAGASSAQGGGAGASSAQGGAGGMGVAGAPSGGGGVGGNMGGGGSAGGPSSGGAGGADGSSGTSGEAGASGGSGTGGISGTAGAPGTSGGSGTGGAAGSGGSGTGGAAGSGGSGGGGVGGASPTPEQQAACGDYSNAFCAWLAACDPLDLTAAFATIDACRTAASVGCVHTFGLPAVTATASDVDACASSFTAATPQCGAPDCPLMGTKADGDMCQVDAECAGGLCFAALYGCGVCETRLPAGAACSSSTPPCVVGATCSSTSMTCVPLGDKGSPCSGAFDCVYPLRCISGTCADGLSSGAPCDSFQCDPVQGLACDATSHCAPGTFANEGETCASGSTFVDCRGDLYCQFDPAGNVGTCAKKVPIGGACPSDQTLPCVEPAYCINGTCTLDGCP